MSERRGVWPFLAGLAWGVIGLAGIEAVIAVKALARSGGAWKAMREAVAFRKATPQTQPGAKTH